MIASVKDIIKLLEKLEPEDTLAVTWWAKDDILSNLGLAPDGMTPEQIDDTWDMTNGDLDNAIDNAIGDINDEWWESIARYTGLGEK